MKIMSLKEENYVINISIVLFLVFLLAISVNSSLVNAENYNQEENGFFSSINGFFSNLFGRITGSVIKEKDLEEDNSEYDENGEDLINTNDDKDNNIGNTSEENKSRMIGIKLSDLQEKIDKGERPEWAMEHVENHTDHYTDSTKEIAVIPLEAWNEVLKAVGEEPKPVEYDFFD